MKLPNVITALVESQNNADSLAYANCFSETAQVFDEGKTHVGKTAIKNWIEHANEVYRAAMKPLEYDENRQILKAEISGAFDGSPIVLGYEFDIVDGRIRSLKIG